VLNAEEEMNVAKAGGTWAELSIGRRCLLRSKQSRLESDDVAVGDCRLVILRQMGCVLSHSRGARGSAAAVRL
jgi:hypothetical protein